MCNLINTHTHTHTHTVIMIRMTGSDCAVVRNLINKQTDRQIDRQTQTHTQTDTHPGSAGEGHNDVYGMRRGLA